MQTFIGEKWLDPAKLCLAVATNFHPPTPASSGSPPLLPTFNTNSTTQTSIFTRALPPSLRTWNNINFKEKNHDWELNYTAFIKYCLSWWFSYSITITSFSMFNLPIYWQFFWSHICLIFHKIYTLSFKLNSTIIFWL